MSKLKVVDLDFFTAPAPLSRPIVQDEPGSHIKREPIWKTKRAKFWQCSKGGIWRKPFMIVWVIALVALFVYELYCHLGARGVEYRHNASIEAGDFFATHGVFFPIHDFITVSGKHAGWTRQDTSPSTEAAALFALDIYQQSMFEEMDT